MTYPDTAEVSFIQPFWENGVRTDVEDVVRLVKYQGQWRWFFGRTSEFVQEQIAKFAPPSLPNSLPDLVAASLDIFWRQVFTTSALPYQSPAGFVGFVSSIATPCGVVGSTTGPAAYCGLNQTIYYDAGVEAGFEQRGPIFAWVTIIAHEWGHHVQWLLKRFPGTWPGVNSSNMGTELEADCYAGAYVQDAQARGLVASGDITATVMVSAAAGDPIWVPQNAPGAHGTNDQRVTAFMRGYIDGLAGCSLTR